MKKYSTFLTVLLVILAISLIVLVGYSIYTLLDDYMADKSSEDLLSQFEDIYQPEDNQEPSEEEPGNQEPTEEVQTPTENNNKPVKNGETSSYGLGAQYKGNKVIGIISIPKLNIQYPIFNVNNSDTLRVGTVAIYPTNMEEALNTPGNVVIAGHNYRNSRMFSKLYTLTSGDSIYITNMYGNKLEYKVYNVYETLDTDFTYATRNTNNYTEISLTTCTNDASTRTIVWARAE